MTEIEQWLINNYGQEFFTPGLSRIKEALGVDLIKILNQKRIVTIAGTNGKGETTLRLGGLLEESTRCVWVSPHIERINERMSSEEGEISHHDLSRLVYECNKKVKTHGFKLTYYEFLFFVFCQWVKERDPEYILLEVGLGGRLDAVNVLDAELVLLPSISRDHQEFLGRRYDQILGEKLGVLRPKATLIHFLETCYLRDRAQYFSTAIGARVISLEETMSIPCHEFSKRNRALSEEAFFFLTQKRRKDSLVLRNRGEVIHKNGVDWFLSGSHNVDGMRKLIQFLNSGTYNLKASKMDLVIVAFSKRDLLDLRVMMKMLRSLKASRVVMTSFSHPKALDKEVAQRLALEEGLEFVHEISSVISHQESGQILVTGSYYFLGHIRELAGL
jgi:dihydrofolate synthase / folylpolyglutamate synthase